MSAQRRTATLWPFDWRAPALDPFARWIIALLLFLAVLAVRLTLSRESSLVFLPFYPVVLIAAWISGRGPALVVTGAAAACAWWFLIRNPGSADWPNPAEAGRLVLFVAVNAFAVWLVSGLTRLAAAAEMGREIAEHSLEAEQSLARELQHRVANNLQLVASAILLQARAVPGTPQAAALADATRRLDAVARLHRRLISPDATSDAASILREVCQAQDVLSGDSRVKLNLDLQPDIRLDAGRLTTLGMIVSEGVNNVLKHAFPDGLSGQMDVSLRRTEDLRLELTIRDNGVGLPPHFNSRTANSLGLNIMRSLSHRLGGRLTLQDNDRGALLRVTFPETDSRSHPLGGSEA